MVLEVAGRFPKLIRIGRLLKLSRASQLFEVDSKIDLGAVQQQLKVDLDVGYF